MDKQKLHTVWSGITKDPRATVQKLAEQTGLTASTVFHALNHLEVAGHISQRPAQGAPRKIYLGCHEQGPVRIAGEIRDGANGEPVVELYEEFAAA